MKQFNKLSQTETNLDNRTLLSGSSFVSQVGSGSQASQGNSSFARVSVDGAGNVSQNVQLSGNSSFRLFVNGELVSSQSSGGETRSSQSASSSAAPFGGQTSSAVQTPSAPIATESNGGLSSAVGRFMVRNGEVSGGVDLGGNSSAVVSVNGEEIANEQSGNRGSDSAPATTSNVVDDGDQRTVNRSSASGRFVVNNGVVSGDLDRDGNSSVRVSVNGEEILNTSTTSNVRENRFDQL